MKTKIQAVTASVIALILLAGCAAPVSLNAFPTANKPLKAGDSFSITLEGNAATGYVWEYEMQPQGAFELVKFESKAKRGAAGAPSVSEWVFKTLTPVSGTLVFRYRRPWENEEPLTLLRYEVTVD